MKRSLLIAALTALSLPLSALAQYSADTAATPGGIDSDTFNQIDLDQDGFITRDEAAGTELADRFDQLDTNHDGQPSPSEITAGSASGGSSSAASGSTTNGDGGASSNDQVLRANWSD